MLTGRLYIEGKADRVLPRSAAIQSSQLYVSIRALTSDNVRLIPTSSNLTFDTRKSQAIFNAIELTALSVECMATEQILIRVLDHMQKTQLTQIAWFVGVSHGPRRHPWDEQELPFSTKAWIVVPAQNSDQAQEVTSQLLRHGFNKSPVHLNAPTATFVFAYAVSTECLN